MVLSVAGAPLATMSSLQKPMHPSGLRFITRAGTVWPRWRINWPQSRIASSGSLSQSTATSSLRRQGQDRARRGPRGIEAGTRAHPPAESVPWSASADRSVDVTGCELVVPSLMRCRPCIPQITGMNAAFGDIFNDGRRWSVTRQHFGTRRARAGQRSLSAEAGGALPSTKSSSLQSSQIRSVRAGDGPPPPSSRASKPRRADRRAALDTIWLNARVTTVARQNHDRMKDAGRNDAAFVVRVQSRKETRTLSRVQ